MDILDYRLAANIIENAGDTIVSITSKISSSMAFHSLSASQLKLIYEYAKDIEEIQTKSVDAFLSNNRTLALNAINHHKNFLKKVSTARINPKAKLTPTSDALAFFDLIKQIENYEKAWADILDLIQPSYK